MILHCTPDDAEGTSVPRVVAIAPSHCTPKFMHSTLIVSIEFWESLQFLTSSQASSGVSGPYCSGKVLKWVREKSINAMEEIILLK
jgi:hypothetical protein